MRKIFSKITKRFIRSVLILLLAIVAGLTAFYLYNPGKAITLVFPDLNKINYINTIIKNDSAYTKLYVILENKNPYKLTIDTLSYDIKLNDTSIAHQVVPLNISQSRFDLDTTRIPLNLNIKKIKTLIAHLEGIDSTNFEISGFVVYKTIFGRVKFDYSRKKRIVSPVPPKIRIIKVERKSFSFKEKLLKADATIEITNKGKMINLQLIRVHYDLRVKNTLRSVGEVKKVIVIKPGSTVTFVLPMDIKVYHPVKTAVLIKLDKDRLEYTLHLTGIIKENISDDSFTSPVEVFSSGTMELKK